MKPEWKLLVLNLPYLLFVYLFAKMPWRRTVGRVWTLRQAAPPDGISVRPSRSRCPACILFDPRAWALPGRWLSGSLCTARASNAKKYRKGQEYGFCPAGDPAKHIAP